ncbi:MAG: hypothetical protein ABI882_19340 [Acidobacteriota bacterium]
MDRQSRVRYHLLDLCDLPGAGHYVFLRRADEVIKEMRKFIESL